MKLGVCTNPANIQIAADCGYDYLECSLTYLAGLSEEEYQALLAQKPTFPIPITCCNGMLPAEVPITGPKADPQQQIAYVDKAFARASALGIKIVVFGSNTARNVPEGACYTEGWRQIAGFLRLCIPYCEKYGITIAIEPLRRVSANILNLVSEAQILAALIDHPRITVLADTFHMLSCHEPWDAMTKAGKLLTHVHISYPTPDLSTRYYPAPDDGCEDYAVIIETLKAMHYEGGISVEAAVRDFPSDCKAAAECLKPLL